MNSQHLPPGQQLVARGKWPIVGERTPRDDVAPWTVSVGGLVAHPGELTLADLAAMPQVQQTVDIHCVTRWSRFDTPFGGVLLADLLARCDSLPAARYVSFIARSARGHSTSLPLAEALKLKALIALRFEDAPLEPIHGGPVRVVVPERYFYKSLKWLERIELLAEDRLGYWEQEAGYHNTADPWREERYLAPQLDRLEVQRLLDARDFSGCDLRSLSAAGRDLRGLVARGALLRDADFRRANLQGADFTGANLSNAHLAEADLRGASFAGADVEGADFTSADLRGADFRGAFLTAATFTDGQRPAHIDATTLLDRRAVDDLTPQQASYILEALGDAGGEDIRQSERSNVR
jgi:DMSO/TMAO reductase YedYZ molybdopterin-dependent catalytic subunit